MEDSHQGTEDLGDHRREKRRTQGREAQRRFRLRKDQAIQDLQIENETLQGIIEDMSTSILQFGDRLWTAGLFNASKPLANEWKAFLAKVLELVEKAQKTTEEHLDEATSANAFVPGEKSSEQISHSSSSTTVTTAPTSQSYFPTVLDERPSISDISARMRELTERSPREHRSPVMAFNSPQGPISPGLSRMLTLNPVMADDYLDPGLLEKTNISFAKRLCRASLLRAYRGLEQQSWEHQAISQDSWTTRFFKYSFETASTEALIALVRSVLKSLMTDDEDVPATGWEQGLEYKRLRLAWHFNKLGQQRVGLETRRKMSADGLVWEDLLDAEQVEDYLTRSGILWDSLRQAYVQIMPAVPTGFNTLMTPEATHASTPREQVFASVDIEVVIAKLVETSVCLGDGIGFWRHTIDEAFFFARR